MSNAQETASKNPPDGEVTILVVDDAAVDLRMTGAVIERSLGWRVAYAEDGMAALAAMARHLPRLVLTDLRMPRMNGLELVAAVRAKYPAVPVVLMTAYGNEEIAIKALRQGAASYVPKRSPDVDLVATLEQVVAATRQEHRQNLLLDRLTQSESSFILDNDRTLIPDLVSHIQDYLSRFQLCDDTGRIRIGIALEEALLNAIFHGNLEVSSELRQEDESLYYQAAEQRRRELPYMGRRVHFTYKLTRTEGVFTVRDHGPGFNPASLPDPTDPENIGRIGGRGLFLIRTFMDEVTFCEKGNQITMVKRRDR